MISAIVLPGLDGSAPMRERFCRALAIAVDPLLVPFPPQSAAGYDELLSMVAASLPSSRSFILIGESFSGPLACALAATRPAGLRCLVLCASFARYPVPAPAWLIRLLGRIPLSAVPERLVAAMLLGAWSTPVHQAELISNLKLLPPNTVTKRLLAATSVDVRPLLKQITVPALVLQASHDRLVPARAGSALARALPEARLHRVSGPHALLQACPLACATAILDFARVQGIVP